MPNRLDETLTPDLLARMAACWRPANDLMEHRQSICKHGQEFPEIRGWTWGGRQSTVEARSGSGSGA
jgi:hypothetical protein